MNRIAQYYIYRSKHAGICISTYNISTCNSISNLCIDRKQ